MALEYFLYTTLYNNTLVDRSESSFTPLPPNTGEIQIDYFIPEIQPLYFYKESGGTIVFNDQTTVETYYNAENPTTGDDYVLQSTFTATTQQIDIDITNVENAIVSVDNKITFVSGQTSGNTVAIQAQQTQFNNFTGTTLPTNYYNKTEINSYSASTLSNINSRLLTSNFDSYSASTNITISANTLATIINSNDIAYLSGVTSGATADISQLRTDVDSVSGQTTGNTESIGLLTLVVAGKLDKSTFTGYTATTEVTLDALATGITANYDEITLIKDDLVDLATGQTANYNLITGNTADITYLSGQTDLKLNTSDFNTYSGTTNDAITANTAAIVSNDNDIAYLSGQTDLKLNTADFNVFSGTTLPTNYYNKTEINTYSAATDTQIESKIPKVSGATAGNLVILTTGGTLLDAGVSIDSITGGTGFYFYTETGVTLTNSTATDVSFINATGLSLQAGTWSVDFTALGGNDSRNRTIDIGYYVDGILQAVRIDFNTNASANRISFPISIDLPLTAGDHIFEIRFNTPDGGTAVIDWGSIRAKLVK